MSNHANHRQKRSLYSQVGILVALCVLLSPAPPVQAQAESKKTEQSALSSVKWQEGPLRADLGDIAQIQVPEGYLFVGTADTQLLMRAMGNPASGRELGSIWPNTRDWFVIFEFSDIGYVKDDEKDKLDADAVLKAIREGNDRANEERRKMGWPPLTIVGWERPPMYNTETNNLEWAIRGHPLEGSGHPLEGSGQSEGQMVVNYNTRLLGRRGVMESNLVLGPEQLAATLPSYKKLLDGYAFRSGQRYAEFRSGDKIAQYGLTALMVGGGAAIAAKSGMLSKIWKLLVVGFLGLAGFLKKLFKKPSRETDFQPR